MDNRIMSVLNDVLKHKRVINKDKFDYLQVAKSSINVGYMEGKKIDRVIIYLRGKGCDWSCQMDGGCLMCGHYYGTSQGEELPQNAYFKQFQNEIAKYDFSDIPVLCIYNAGSILNNKEVPTEELLKMLEMTSKYPHIKRIVLESRPEFVDTDILERISAICKDKIVEIGMGLETSNNEIREKCINKGFDFLSYIEAVCRVRKFPNLKVLTYLTVKPLFLTIDESINDVVESVFDIQHYTDIISLEPVSIQKNTVVEYLFEMEIYNPPKGWMIKEILQKLSNMEGNKEIDLRIGGFEFFPIPDLVISNCEKCNASLYKAIDEYNSLKKSDAIRQLECSCYKDYCEVKKRESWLMKKTLGERIEDSIRKILLKLVV